MPHCKYSDEVLRAIFEPSFSYAGVLRKLGLKQTGGSQSNIKRLAQKYEISTDIFSDEREVKVMRIEAELKR